MAVVLTVINYTLQWTLILSAELQDGSMILEWFHYSNIPAGGYLTVRGGWLACLLSDWLGRSASQERFYDWLLIEVHLWASNEHQSAGAVGPDSRPFCGSPAVSGLLISATMKVRLGWFWSSCPISRNGPTWLSPAADTATWPPPWQLPRRSVHFGRIINMWV